MKNMRETSGKFIFGGDVYVRSTDKDITKAHPECYAAGG